MSYLYTANLDVFDRSEQLEIMLDSGDSAILRRGHYYDLTAGELARAQRYVTMTFVATAPDEAPVGVRYLPIKGNPTNGQIPVFDATQGDFVPAGVSGVGGASAIPFTPTGTVVATNTQAAIAEVSADVVSVETKVAVVQEAPLNVDDSRFGGSVQAAHDYLGSFGGVILVPGDLAENLVITKSGVTIRGLGKWKSKLHTASGDLISFGTGASSGLTHINFEDIWLQSAAGGGHVFRANLTSTGGLSQVRFDNVRAAQDNAAKSIWQQVDDGALIDMVWDGPYDLQHVDGASVPGFNLKTANGDMNTLRWCAGGRFTYSGAYFIHAEQTAAGTYLYDINIEAVNAEVLRGGLVKFLSVQNCHVEKTGNYDMAVLGASTQHFVYVGKSTLGPASRGVSVSKMVRANGVLGGGLVDIFLQGSGAVIDFEVDNVRAAGGSGFTIDANGNTLRTGGRLSGVTILNGTDNNISRVDPLLTGVPIKSKAGVPVDADFAYVPPVGTQVIDTTNNRLYTKTLATEGWNYAGPDVQVFNANGSPQTWTKPLGATAVEVYIAQPGGGGGAGRRGAAGTVRTGGGGGAGGNASLRRYRASLLSATETVVVGFGGAGGAAGTVDDTDGAPGVAGLSTYFKGQGFSGVSAAGTLGGAGGNVGVAAGGATGGADGASGGAGGASSTTAAGGPGGNALVGAPTAACGGGAGGTVVVGNTNTNGGAGSGHNGLGGGAAGTGAGGNGGTVVPAGNELPSVGGGGGAGGGGTGGAGAFPGGGGGGGGGSLNGTASGAGGAGGDGLIIVTSFLV